MNYQTNNNQIEVVKASGHRELFSEEKLQHSINRAGIPKNLHDKVLGHVQKNLYQGIKTSEIYHHVSEFLENSENPYAKSQYSLKQGLMHLGPTGYPFEDFISELLTAKGYTTTVRSILQGKCVSHEIDVLAKKDGKTIAIECKFHNTAGTRSDVHVAMYTKARFDDIKDENYIDEMWLVCNTKATLDAISYGMCGGVRILSWNYPHTGSLRDLIEDTKLHPITQLNTLTFEQKQKLLINHVVTTRDFRENKDWLQFLNLSQSERDSVFAEINYLTG